MLLRRYGPFYAISLVAILSACATGQNQSPGLPATPELSIHYVAQGSGEPVVLVHGFSQTHKAWLQTPLYNDLVQDHYVVAIDLRGHGDSYKPHDPEDYGLNLKSDLIELLDHLSLEKAHFIGFSLSANVVGDLVVTSPGRVQTATMGSGYFARWDEEEERFAQFTENREGDSARHPCEPKSQDFRALAALIRGTRFLSVSDEQTATITTPILMVFGRLEVEQMTAQQSERLKNLPRSIDLLIVDGANHDSRNAAVLSTEFSRAVRDLIASNSTK